MSGIGFGFCAFEHATEWQIGCSDFGVAQLLAIQGKDGWSGIIHSWARGSDEVTLRLDNGEKLVLPASLLTTRPDGTYYVPLSLDQIRGKAESADVPVAVPDAEPR